MARGVDAETDRRAIIGVVNDYFESWWEGDPERMGRSLHPDLAKRAPMAALLAFGVDRDLDPDALDQDTRQTMVDATARGVGATRAPSAQDRAIEVVVEDVYQWIASVTVRSPIYQEYVHLVRTRDGWKIVNTLWQRTMPEGGEASG